MALRRDDYAFERGRHNEEFNQAEAYGKIRLGSEMLFWKEGLRWHALELKQVKRIYRQVEHVYGRLCCGGRSYDIQRLIVQSGDGGSIRMHIGDDCREEAERLLDALKAAQPQIQYGKETK